MGKLRYDIGRLQPVRRMPNGTIVADAHLTRAGVFEYRNPDGSTRRELRLPEEVFRPDSMRTFAMVPTTDDHPPEMIDATNAIKFAKGATGETITRDDDHMRGSIAVFDASTIKKMEMGKLQLSCGYTCDLDEVPGIHPLWGKYDAIQRNIVGNHVALVEHGRAGRTASVRMDAAVQLDGDWDEGAHPRGPGGKFGEGSGGDLAKPSSAAQVLVSKPASGRGTPLNANEKLLLKTMATTKVQKGSDSKVLKKLGITASHAASIANSAREKLGLSPLHNLREHAVALHKSGKLIITKNDAARSDALGVPFSGTPLARSKTRGTVVARPMASIPNARIEVVVRRDDEQVDPDDLANRNARGENDDEQPAGPPDDPDPSYEGEGSEMDASYGGMYDDDGNLSESGASRVAASSFAVPGKSKLPIHDPKAVRDSMKRFGGHSFDDADEKHGAFNRISGRAKQFGINCDAFRRAYSGKLDRKDQAMIDAKTQAKAAKADIRKKQRDEAIARADAADKELAAAQGKIESLTKDLELAKGGTEKTRTDAADKFDFAVAAKVDLVTKAAAVLGAKVDIKASDLDIMKAVIKHVDGKDVTDTRPGYVEALFDGAVERGRADAAAKVAGAQALGAARAAVITPAVVVPPVVPAAPAAAVPHADASVNDEANAAAAMRARTASLAFQANPQGTSKHAVIARQGRS